GGHDVAGRQLDRVAHQQLVSGTDGQSLVAPYMGGRGGKPPQPLQRSITTALQHKSDRHDGDEDDERDERVFTLTERAVREPRDQEQEHEGIAQRTRNAVWYHGRSLRTTAQERALIAGAAPAF